LFRSHPDCYDPATGLFEVRRLFLFHALASGSSGNAYLLRTGKVKLLFEAGIGMARLERYLLAEGVRPAELTAVVVSHEHRDHCGSARELAEKHGVPVCANVDVLRAAGLHGLRQAHVLALDRPYRFGDVDISCFRVEHDAVCPVGFLIGAAGRTICLATDLGQPTPPVAEAVALADLVILEANHDLELLQHGRYPYYLRRRVAGPTGHLSNSQAAGILARSAKGANTEVWLAHLSKENNSPALALRTVKQMLRASGLEDMPVQVALRDRPSLRWSGEPRPRQLSLFSEGDACTA
jgi:phosphoribosyl 1,2-cyclic phosphodiesterase